MYPHKPCARKTLWEHEPMSPDPSDDHTFATKFRLPRRMWETYGRVLGDRDRSADLLDHVRATINARGNAHDLAELNAAEQELAERRSRKGGRPRAADKRPDAGTEARS